MAFMHEVKLFILEQRHIGGRALFQHTKYVAAECQNKRQNVLRMVAISEREALRIRAMLGVTVKGVKMRSQQKRGNFQELSIGRFIIILLRSSLYIYLNYPTYFPQ